jgi:predicted RNase H-like nuclease (RuvC/YqgF family)
MSPQDARDLGKWATIVDENTKELAAHVTELCVDMQRLEARVERQHKLIEMLIDTLKELAK